MDKEIIDLAILKVHNIYESRVDAETMTRIVTETSSTRSNIRFSSRPIFAENAKVDPGSKDNIGRTPLSYASEINNLP